MTRMSRTSGQNVSWLQVGVDRLDVVVQAEVVMQLLVQVDIIPLAVPNTPWDGKT